MKFKVGYLNGWPTIAACGGLIWLLIGLLSLLDLIRVGLLEQLYLLAPLTIIPLGLARLESLGLARYQKALYLLIRIGQPISALLVVLAFLVPAGLLAGGLALTWLALTGLIALWGLLRFINRGYYSIAETSIDAGLIYLAIGGGWLLMSRLGLNPLGFDDLIVLLTAVHFHYAGFAAPLIAGLAGRALVAAPPTLWKLHRVSVFGVIAGTPLVAAGITFSPLLEIIGAIVIATSLTLLAYLIRFIVLRLTLYRPAQLLLTISAISILIGMFFTYLYVIGEFTGYPLVSIPQMVRIHGVVNALGFALCGLLGWALLPPSSPTPHLH
jgi:hypothetical protein